MLRTRRAETIDLRWLSHRSVARRWYPQGIDVGTWRDRRTLAVSWFRKDRTGERHVASRIALIDLQRRSSIDVALAIEGADGRLEPARIHAGGIAWTGDRLLVAATFDGIWEFDLGAVLEVHGADARRLVGSERRGPGSRRLALVRTRVHAVPLRCSFLGRTVDADGTPSPRVLVGEYRTDDAGRIATCDAPDADAACSMALDADALDVAAPGVECMQGAVAFGDTVLVSQSRDMQPGVLWSGRRDALRRTDVALPVGCEDLAIDVDGGVLWTLGEHPWRRVVRGIPIADLGL